MKASPESQLLLLEIQSIDTQLKQLEHKIANLPESVAVQELQSELDAARQAELLSRGPVEDSRAELRRVESDVDVVKSRIDRDKERLEGTSSVKDVAGLETELASLKKRLDDLEDIELTVMERLESQEVELNSAVQKVADIEQQLANALENRSNVLGSANSEVDHLNANRAEISSKIPSDLLDLYEKQRSRYGVGASLLQRGISSASGMKLTESDLAEIRTALPDDVILCPDSNAILVRTGESGL